MKPPLPTNDIPTGAKRRLRGSWLPASVFVVLGLVTSLALIPRDYQLALREIEQGELANAIERLERLQDEGDQSPSVAAALARAYIDSGDLESAISSLEEISRLRPDDMTILQTLAELNIGIGRVAAHVAVLERQQAIAPERARQVEIAQLYGELGDTAARRAALWKLVRTFDARPQILLELARLEASHGRPEDALAALDIVHEAPRNKSGAEALSLAIILELALGNERGAIERGQAWLANHHNLSQAIPAIYEPFQTRRRFDLLIELIEPYATEGAPLEVFAALTEAYFRAGDLTAADGVLDRMKTMAGLHPEAMQERLRLAQMSGNVDHMLDIARQIEPEAIPGSVIKDVIGAAILRGDLRTLRKIAGQVGEDFFHDDPGLAANVMIALREFETARAWVEIARTQGADDPAVLLSAAEADYQLGRAARSLQALRDIFGEPRQVGASSPGTAPGDAVGFPYERLPQDRLTAAAYLYVGLGVPHEGRAALDRYRRAHPSRAADLAWALAAAATGASREVQAWQAEAADLPSYFLDDLASYAIRAGAFDLAVSAATRLVAARGSDADKMLMATAMHLASHPLQTAPDTPLKN